MEILRSAHPVFAIVLLVGYGFLAVRLFLQKSENLGPIDRLLSQVVRISLLVVYLSGLVMSMNLGLWASKFHHYASLLPVVVMFIFQFVPQFLQKQTSLRGYAIFFLGMFLSILIISLSSDFLHF